MSLFFVMCELYYTTEESRNQEGFVPNDCTLKIMDIFRRPLQKNSFNRRKLRREKTSLSLVSMSSADELLNGNGRMAVNQ